MKRRLLSFKMIFCVPQDGTNIQSYGGTTFIIKSSCGGGDTATAAALGIDDGWGGTLVTIYGMMPTARSYR